MCIRDSAFVEAEIAKPHAGSTVVALPAAPQLSASARALLDALRPQGELKRLLEVRVPELIAYQDEAYAKRYADVIQRVLAAEQQKLPGQTALSEAVARNLYKLMAYKDEFEVARLHSDPAFLAQLATQFPNGYSVKYNLAPPLVAQRDPSTGELQKKQYGGWMLSAFQWLAKFKGLRGGALDVFSKTEERHTELALITDYVKLMDEVIQSLNATNHASAVALASVPDEIRGYGHVKAQSLVTAKALQAQHLQAFRNPQSVKLAA